MFSRTEVVPTDDIPLTLSLEFVWKAKSTYWAGEIKVIDLYIDGQLRYTIDIPQRDDREAQAISIPFKKHSIGLSGSEINYLIIKNLDTTRKITLKAGIFNKKEGNTLRENFDRSWSRDIRFTREDVSVDLDVSSFKLGNHYKIIAIHGMKRTSPGSSFWEGKGLHTIIEENGPSKKNAAAPSPTLSTSLFNSSNHSETRRDKALPSQGENLKLMQRIIKTQQQVQSFSEEDLKKITDGMSLTSDMWRTSEGLDLIESRIEDFRKAAAEEKTRLENRAYEIDIQGLESMIPGLENSRTNRQFLSRIIVKFASYAEENEDYKSRPLDYYKTPKREVRALDNFAEKANGIRSKLQKQLRNIAPDSVERNNLLADAIKVYVINGRINLYYARIRVEDYPRTAISVLYRAKKIFEIAQHNAQILETDPTKKIDLLKICEQAMDDANHDFLFYKGISSGSYKDTVTEYEYADDPLAAPGFINDEWDFLKLVVPVRALPSQSTEQTVTPSFGDKASPTMFGAEKAFDANPSIASDSDATSNKDSTQRNTGCTIC